MKNFGPHGGNAMYFHGNPRNSLFWKFGPLFAFRAAMSSSLDSIYKKLASSLESSGAGYAHEAKQDPARHIPPVVAHELNNILTIIQGYADRLLLKHGENPTMNTQLKLISEAARRAATLVHTAVQPEVDMPPRPQPDSQQLVSAT